MILTHTEARAALGSEGRAVLRATCGLQITRPPSGAVAGRRRGPIRRLARPCLVLMSILSSWVHALSSAHQRLYGRFGVVHDFAVSTASYSGFRPFSIAFMAQCLVLVSLRAMGTAFSLFLECFVRLLGISR